MKKYKLYNTYSGYATYGEANSEDEFRNLPNIKKRLCDSRTTDANWVITECADDATSVATGEWQQLYNPERIILGKLFAQHMAKNYYGEKAMCKICGKIRKFYEEYGDTNATLTIERMARPGDIKYMVREGKKQIALL